MFSAKEIKSSVSFYIFRNRLKVVTFVPETHVTRLLLKMSSAGAGRIGNYTKCSFSAPGKGTFHPGGKSTPYSGKKGELSVEHELRFEMECGVQELNKVIDEMLENHPYEEPAYEIYEFVKRDRKPSGTIYELRHQKPVASILRELEIAGGAAEGELRVKISRVAVTGHTNEHEVMTSAAMQNCGFAVIKTDTKTQYIIINT